MPEFKRREPYRRLLVGGDEKSVVEQIKDECLVRCLDGGGVTDCPTCDEAPSDWDLYFPVGYKDLERKLSIADPENCLWESAAFASPTTFAGFDLDGKKWQLTIGDEESVLELDLDGTNKLRYKKSGPWCCLCTNQLVLECPTFEILPGQALSRTVCVVPPEPNTLVCGGVEMAAIWKAAVGGMANTERICSNSSQCPDLNKNYILKGLQGFPCWWRVATGESIRWNFEGDCATCPNGCYDCSVFLNMTVSTSDGIKATLFFDCALPPVGPWTALPFAWYLADPFDPLGSNTFLKQPVPWEGCTGPNSIAVSPVN